MQSDGRGRGGYPPSRAQHPTGGLYRRVQQGDRGGAANWGGVGGGGGGERDRENQRAGRTDFRGDHQPPPEDYESWTHTQGPRGQGQGHFRNRNQNNHTHDSSPAVLRVHTGQHGQQLLRQQNVPMHPQSPNFRRTDVAMKLPEERWEPWTKSRRVEGYEESRQVGEGTYAKVYKARDKANNTYVAIKTLRMENERDAFPFTAIREVKFLTSLKHENILQVREALSSHPGDARRVEYSMVFEYMDHDLAGLLHSKQHRFEEPQIKCLARQMLGGLAFLHSRKILHRDIKAANILLNEKLQLKLADFGLARYLGDPALKEAKEPDCMTNRVVTLWYRAPELCMGSTNYGPEIDIWSAGCVLVEFFTYKAIFTGNDEISQLNAIWSICGTPDEQSYPEITKLQWYGLLKPKADKPRVLLEKCAEWGLPELARDLVDKLLATNPLGRLSAEEATNHPWFTTDPLPCEPHIPVGIGRSWHEYESKKRAGKGGPATPEAPASAVGRGPSEPSSVQRVQRGSDMSMGTDTDARQGQMTGGAPPSAYPDPASQPFVALEERYPTTEGPQRPYGPVDMDHMDVDGDFGGPHPPPRSGAAPLERDDYRSSWPPEWQDRGERDRHQDQRRPMSAEWDYQENSQQRGLEYDSRQRNGTFSDDSWRQNGPSRSSRPGGVPLYHQQDRQQQDRRPQDDGREEVPRQQDGRWQDHGWQDERDWHQQDEGWQEPPRRASSRDRLPEERRHDPPARGSSRDRFLDDRDRRQNTQVRASSRDREAGSRGDSYRPSRPNERPPEPRSQDVPRDTYRRGQSRDTRPASPPRHSQQSLPGRSQPPSPPGGRFRDERSPSGRNRDNRSPVRDGYDDRYQREPRQRSRSPRLARRDDRDRRSRSRSRSREGRRGSPARNRSRERERDRDRDRDRNREDRPRERSRERSDRQGNRSWKGVDGDQRRDRTPEGRRHRERSPPEQQPPPPPPPRHSRASSSAEQGGRHDSHEGSHRSGNRDYGRYNDGRGFRENTSGRQRDTYEEERPYSERRGGYDEPDNRRSSDRHSGITRDDGYVKDSWRAGENGDRGRRTEGERGERDRDRGGKRSRHESNRDSASGAVSPEHKKRRNDDRDSRGPTRGNFAPTDFKGQRSFDNDRGRGAPTFTEIPMHQQEQQPSPEANRTLDTSIIPEGAIPVDALETLGATMDTSDNQDKGPDGVNEIEMGHSPALAPDDAPALSEVASPDDGTPPHVFGSPTSEGTGRTVKNGVVPMVVDQRATKTDIAAEGQVAEPEQSGQEEATSMPTLVKPETQQDVEMASAADERQPAHAESTVLAQPQAEEEPRDVAFEKPESWNVAQVEEPLPQTTKEAPPKPVTPEDDSASQTAVEATTAHLSQPNPFDVAPTVTVNVDDRPVTQAGIPPAQGTDAVENRQEVVSMTRSASNKQPSSDDPLVSSQAGSDPDDSLSEESSGPTTGKVVNLLPVTSYGPASQPPVRPAPSASTKKAATAISTASPTAASTGGGRNSRSSGGKVQTSIPEPEPGPADESSRAEPSETSHAGAVTLSSLEHGQTVEALHKLVGEPSSERPPLEPPDVASPAFRPDGSVTDHVYTRRASLSSQDGTSSPDPLTK